MKNNRLIIVALCYLPASCATHTIPAVNIYTISPEWSEAPVRMFLLLFQIALAKNSQFSAVLPATSIAKTDYLIESTLCGFSHHINQDGSSDGVLRIRFYLINNATKALIATRELVSKVQVASLNVQGAAASLNRAA